LYDTDGAKGAALGAGIGNQYYSKPKEAFLNMERIGLIEPDDSKSAIYEEIYHDWKAYLETKL
jgi:xylulokinase